MSIKASENVLMFAACKSDAKTKAIVFSNLPDGTNYHGALTGYFMKKYGDASSCSWRNFDLALESIFNSIKSSVESISTPVLEDGNIESSFYLRFYDN